MKRERYLDIVKGFSIWCIVLMHYVNGIFPETICVFTGSFMITAFYVVTGWLTAMNPQKICLYDFISKRFRQLGIPYLYWSGIIFLLDIFLWGTGYYDTQFILGEVYKTFTFRGIGTLWFLPALFGGEILWYILKTKDKRIIFLMFLITVCYQWLYGNIFIGKTVVWMRILDAPFRTLYNISQAWIGIAFGYYAYHLSRKFINQHLNLCVNGVAFLILAYITANYLPLHINVIWFYIAPLWGPLGLIYLAKVIQRWGILNFFNYWGMNSLSLMITHYSITLVILKIIIYKICDIPFEGRITLIAFVLSIPIQYMWVSIINKYAKFTLGK